MNIFLGSKVLENKACLHVFSNGYYVEVHRSAKILMKNQALNRKLGNRAQLFTLSLHCVLSDFDEIYRYFCSVSLVDWYAVGNIFNFGGYSEIFSAYRIGKRL